MPLEQLAAESEYRIDRMALKRQIAKCDLKRYVA